MTFWGTFKNFDRLEIDDQQTGTNVYVTREMANSRTSRGGSAFSEMSLDKWSRVLQRALLFQSEKTLLRPCFHASRLSAPSVFLPASHSLFFSPVIARPLVPERETIPHRDKAVTVITSKRVQLQFEPACSRRWNFPRPEGGRKKESEVREGGWGGGEGKEIPVALLFGIRASGHG